MPDTESLCSKEPIVNGPQEVPAHTKEILNRSVHREEALHLALALPGRLGETSARLLA